MPFNSTPVAHISTVHQVGDPRIFHKEAHSLAEAGYDVSYFVHTDANEWRDEIRIQSLGTADTRIERWRSIPRLYRMAVGHEADVYHFHDPELIPVGLALSLRTDAAVVYDAHENYGRKILSRDWIPRPIRSPLARAFPTIQNAVARRFDAVVAATEWIAESFQESGLERVVTVRNFPRTRSISLPSDPPVERTHEHVLVYVGNRTRKRGLLKMAAILRGLRERGFDVCLWILGPPGPDRDERAFRQYVDAYGLTEDVQSFGWIDYEDIFGYLDAADVGLALLDPEDSEGLIPTKLFEYMYVNVPVVASDIEGTQRYLPDDCGVRVQFDDEQQQIEAVAELLEADPADESRTGTNGRQRVQARFSWEAEEERLLQLYESIA
ncbi:Glycosyltransferase involved in cell wall bisynthesis [Halomicrobium zhouii]|uniref:Glycosyltransferase involved in cell wall bisynthesis n=1 Tax=Halomicrobium zhouii TaxID=767519 RepID=A0A1I6KFY1_9EURY|nr:glycosyltransferase family 4 protein [Halomicrobium zhouii]SFR90123.1 Glycosyltransferase involved in cell wall bisynthesis [Halomicrobium zhouii]